MLPVGRRRRWLLERALTKIRDDADDLAHDRRSCVAHVHTFPDRIFPREEMQGERLVDDDDWRVLRVVGALEAPAAQHRDLQHLKELRRCDRNERTARVARWIGRAAVDREARFCRANRLGERHRRRDRRSSNAGNGTRSIGQLVAEADQSFRAAIPLPREHRRRDDALRLKSTIDVQETDEAPHEQAGARKQHD
jgi:hypothetical protein